MKTIDTLIEDIYNLLENGIEVDNVDEEAVDRFAKTISTVITDRLTEATKERKERLRLSNIGSDPRELWYKLKGYKGEKLKPHTYFLFLMGDIFEEVLLFLTELSGHTVTHQQHEVSINGIKGHMDCVIDGVPVDVKTASPYSFQKFKDNNLTKSNDSFGYIEQLSSYAQNIEIEHITTRDAAFLVVNKVNGMLTLCELPEMMQVDSDKHSLKMVEMMSRDTPPSEEEAPINTKEFGKSGNIMLGVPHSYHSQKANYLPELRKFIYSTGPVYLTHVEVEPRVLEVDIKTDKPIIKDKVSEFDELQ